MSNRPLVAGFHLSSCGSCLCNGGGNRPRSSLGSRSSHTEFRLSSREAAPRFPLLLDAGGVLRAGPAAPFQKRPASRPELLLSLLGTMEKCHFVGVLCETPSRLPSPRGGHEAAEALLWSLENGMSHRCRVRIRSKAWAAVF